MTHNAQRMIAKCERKVLFLTATVKNRLTAEGKLYGKHVDAIFLRRHCALRPPF